MLVRIKIERFALLCLLLVLMGQQSLAQIGVSDRINQENDRAPSLKALEEAALKETARSDHYGAMRYYHLILDAEPLNPRILKAYGESAIKFAAYDSAAVAFGRLVDLGMTAPDGLPILRLAGIKFQLGDYAKARELYRRYLFQEKIPGATEAMKLEAESKLGDCEWALDLLNHPVVEEGMMAMLDSGVNTVNYSDHSPYLLDSTLYFSTSRFTYEKDKVFPKRTIDKVMTAGGEFYNKDLQIADFNEENRHTRHTTFSPDGKVMYYNICNYDGKNYDVICDLYRRRKNNDGSWGEAEKLPEPVNMPGFTTTEPSVGPVPGEPYDMLYFVSDRPGGKGQKDIWCSKIAGDNFSTPMNVNSLNTTGNDVTPFYHAPSNTFYFSTDSLQSLGGLDVYKSTWNGKIWTNPVNMGVPINSGYNDVYYMLTEDEQLAFMASNRRGSFNESEEGCCYDIYEVNFIRPQMLAITFWKRDGVKTDERLPFTNITLFDADNPNATPIRVDAGDDAEQAFDLLPGKNYILVADKYRFSSDTVRFSTPPRVWRTPIVKKLYLEPTSPNLIVTVFDANSLEPINGATAKFYDLGERLTTGEFKPGSGKPQVDVHPDNNRYEYPLDFEHRYEVMATKEGYTKDTTEIISTEGLTGAKTLEAQLYIRRGVNLIAHTLNKLTLDTLYGVTYRFLELPSERQLDRFISGEGEKYRNVLDYEKRYRIIASKPNFSSDSLDFSTANLPKVDFQTILKELQLRPLILAQYLPIPLYFDNDEPDKRTLARSTKKEYRTVFVDYINRKDVFIEKFTEPLSGQEKQDATDTLDNFFELEVRGGWNRLMEFSEVLYEMLTIGDSIEITLKGYASPRAGALYNKNLTDRRVSSVYNHFDHFDGGIYKPFVDSGQLVILREANGETKAKPGVSDSAKDDRNSIYEVHASRERRLEIIGVKVNKDQRNSTLEIVRDPGE